MWCLNRKALRKDSLWKTAQLEVWGLLCSLGRNRSLQRALRPGEMLRSFQDQKSPRDEPVHQDHSLFSIGQEKEGKAQLSLDLGTPIRDASTRSRQSSSPRALRGFHPPAAFSRGNSPPPPRTERTCFQASPR